MDNKHNTEDAGAYGAMNYQDNTHNEPNAAEEPVLKWNSKTSINSDRNKVWYLGLILVFTAVAVAFFLFTHDIILSVIILMSGVLISYYGIKPPRAISYEMDDSKILINNKAYNLSSYKYYYINQRQHGGSASLVPLKRLSPSIDLNYDTDNEEKVISKLSNSLPLNQRDTDIFDSILRFIGF